MILDDKPKGVYYRVSNENNDYQWNSIGYGIQKSLESGIFTQKKL